jgi:hypothetical protein
VSNRTRGLIEQVQLRFILRHGLDDFQKCFIDSTAVETGSALVLGKRSSSNFSAPHFLSAEERKCTLKRHMALKRKMSKSAAMGAAKNVAAFLRIHRHPGISMTAYSLWFLSDKAFPGSSWTSNGRFARWTTASATKFCRDTRLHHRCPVSLHCPSCHTSRHIGSRVPNVDGAARRTNVFSFSCLVAVPIGRERNFPLRLDCSEPLG